MPPVSAEIANPTLVSSGIGVSTSSLINSRIEIASVFFHIFSPFKFTIISILLWKEKSPHLAGSLFLHYI